MADDIKLASFPETEVEALAYLYVKQQDLSGKTPSEIYSLYQDAYYEIRKDRQQKKNSGWFTQKHEDLKL